MIAPIMFHSVYGKAPAGCLTELVTAMMSNGLVQKILLNKYKYETLSWVGVNELWKYFQINDSPSQAGTVYGISATTSGYDKSNVQVGDVIQFHNGSIWRHSVIVSKKEGSTVYCAAHTSNEDAKPLDDYLTTYSSYRVAHIYNFITSY